MNLALEVTIVQILHKHKCDWGCTGDSYDCGNNTCTCPRSTPTCVGKICTSPTLPPCTGDSYDCGNNTCTCPRSTPNCVGKICTSPTLPPCTGDSYDCGNNTCTCKSGFTCGGTGAGRKCYNNEPIIILGGDDSRNFIFNSTYTDYFVNNNSQGQPPECWAINDKPFSDLIIPPGFSIGVTSITVPSNMQVSTYAGNSGNLPFINMFKPSNLLKNYPSGSETILAPSDGKIICGFKFEYV